MGLARSNVGAICCASMLIAAPFDVAIPENGFGPYFVRPLMTLIALLGLIAVWGNRDRLDAALVRASMVFVAALGFASAISDEPDLGYAVTLRIGVAVLAFLAASVSVKSVDEVQTVLVGAAIMAVSASLIGFAVLVADAELFFTDSLVGKISVTNGVTRLTRPFSQANVAAMALAPISVLLLAAQTVRTDLSSARRAAMGAAGVAGAIACVLSLSRGGVVAMVVALLCCVVLARRPVALSVSLLPFAVAVAAGTAWLWLPRWSARVEGISTVAERAPSRPEIWGQAVDAFESHPFAGVGPGQFGQFSIDAVSSGVAPSPHAHNVMLEIMATAGLLGAVALAILAGRVMYLVGRAPWSTMTQSPFLFASIAVVVHALVDYALVFTSAGVVTAIVVGGLVGSIEGSDSVSPPTPQQGPTVNLRGG